MSDYDIVPSARNFYRAHNHCGRSCACVVPFQPLSLRSDTVDVAAVDAVAAGVVVASVLCIVSS